MRHHTKNQLRPPVICQGERAVTREQRRPHLWRPWPSMRGRPRASSGGAEAPAKVIAWDLTGREEPP